ncbi:MAG TPA: ABC transporter permease [Clostridiales bacterium]|nr:ABC transporter permease [Clostridiales bacterium]
MGKYTVLMGYYFRKNRGQYISFCFIVAISAAIFSMGLITILNFGKMYERKFEQYHCADVYYTLFDFDWPMGLVEQTEKLNGVTRVETRSNIMLSGASTYGNTGNTLTHIFFDMDEAHTMNILEPVGDTLELDSVDNPIYISYWIKASGCRLGDRYQFVSGDITYSFTIAGFVEDIMYGNNNCGNIGVYLPEDDFARMYNRVDENTHATTLCIGLKDKQDGKKIFTGIVHGLSGNLSYNYEYTYGYFELSQRNRTVTATIVASVLVAFSLILVVITMMVINFRIKSSIEEELQNMGILKAVGYRSRQVVLSVAFPYILLAGIFIPVGILGSYLLLPMVEEVFEQLAGLSWKQSFDPVSASFVMAVIIGLVALTTLLSAGRIRRLHAIEALRSGIKHHNFKRNFFPLAESGWGIHAAMAAKNFFDGIKQNIFLFIILAVMTFAGIYSGSGLYNSMIRTDRFIRVMSEENATVTLKTFTHEQSEEILEELQGDSRVEKAFYYDTENVLIDDQSTAVFIIKDYNKLDNELCYEGRIPLHDNEITLGSSLAEKMKLKTGDVVTVAYGKQKLDYLIVGLMQAPNYNGAACEMTPEGFKRLREEFEPSTVYIYLVDPSKSSAFVDDMIKAYGHNLAAYTDVQAMMKEGFGNFIPLTTMMIGTISIIVLILVAAILYMIIKTMITHRNQELGILKALGFTTGQLMLQISGSLLPVILAGTLAGGILGQFYVDKVWLACFYSLGVRKLSLGIPGLWSVCIVIFLAAFSLSVSILMARRIKKIAATQLIKEC